MNPKLIELLLYYIDARVNEHEAKNSGDGGLMERCRCLELRQEIRDLMQDEQESKP